MTGLFFQHRAQHHARARRGAARLRAIELAGAMALMLATFFVLGSCRSQSFNERPAAFHLAGARAARQFGTQPDPDEVRECLERSRPLLPDDSLEDVVAVGDFDDWNCSGIVVGDSSVLTARHCGTAARVVLGPEVKRACGVYPVVERVSVPEPTLVDLALLRTAFALPVKPRPLLARALRSGELVRLSGFGAADPTGQLGAGRKRVVQVHARGGACGPGESLKTGCLPEIEFSIDGESGKDTCSGDSGGPVLALDEGVWKLAGMTSRPPANANRACADGGIYIRIEAISSFLAEQRSQR